MPLSIDYEIRHKDGLYTLYLVVAGERCALYSSYRYRPCAEVMSVAKHCQVLTGVTEYAA